MTKRLSSHLRRHPRLCTRYAAQDDVSGPSQSRGLGCCTPVAYCCVTAISARYGCRSPMARRKRPPLMLRFGCRGMRLKRKTRAGSRRERATASGRLRQYRQIDAQHLRGFLGTGVARGRVRVAPRAAHFFSRARRTVGPCCSAVVSRRLARGEVPDTVQGGRLAPHDQMRAIDSLTLKQRIDAAAGNAPISLVHDAKLLGEGKASRAVQA